jgi:predicted metal-dependent phosphotriesterase family hydrolase
VDPNWDPNFDRGVREGLRRAGLVTLSPGSPTVTHLEHWRRSSRRVRTLREWSVFLAEVQAAGVPGGAVLSFRETDVPAFVWTEG